jgi:hypothetical protein
LSRSKNHRETGIDEEPYAAFQMGRLAGVAQMMPDYYPLVFIWLQNCPVEKWLQLWAHIRDCYCFQRITLSPIPMRRIMPNENAIGSGSRGMGAPGKGAVSQPIHTEDA